MSFDETLTRVLDPEGVYWSNADEDCYDLAALHLVQLRIDVPPRHVETAIEQMRSNGWNFHENPDEPDDPQQRLFFRRTQDLLPETKTRMLTDALSIVFPIKGARLWTWIIVDDETDD